MLAIHEVSLPTGVFPKACLIVSINSDSVFPSEAVLESKVVQLLLQALEDFPKLQRSLEILVHK